MNLPVHKVIFQVPVVGTEKFAEVKQVYFSPAQVFLKVDKQHEFPVSAGDWSRQRGNRFIQYKDWNKVVQYDFYPSKVYVKPVMQGETVVKEGSVTILQNAVGKVLYAAELAALKGAECARSVAQGGQLQAGLVLCVLCIAVGVFAGLLFGYFGLPVVTGQHLVANPVGGSP